MLPLLHLLHKTSFLRDSFRVSSSSKKNVMETFDSRHSKQKLRDNSGQQQQRYGTYIARNATFDSSSQSQNSTTTLPLGAANATLEGHTVTQDTIKSRNVHGRSSRVAQID